MSRRRDVITFLGGAAVTWSLGTRAQTPKLPVIGFLSAFTKTQSAGAIAAVQRGLGETGFVENKNVTIDYRFSDGQYDRLPGLAKELTSRPLRLILASGPPAAFAAKDATTTIPIVFVVGFDPVDAHLVPSMSRPGGNVTGITHMSDALVQKRLQLLLALVPKANVIAMLVNPVSPDVVPEVRAVKAAMENLGLRLQMLGAATPAEIDAAFAVLAEKRPHAVMIASDPFYLTHAEDLVARVARLGVPAIYPFREFSAFGALISYGTNRTDSYRRAGVYAGRILKGAKPMELPVMQPTLFELVINLRTARALGLTVPKSLLAQADQIVE